MSHVSFASRRRLAALGALAAAGIGVLVLIRGFFESPLAILVAVVALLVGIGFGWVALTRRGPDRTRAATVSLVLLALSLISAVGAHSEGWTIVLGGLAVLGSLPLGRYALGRDRRSLTELTPPGAVVPPARKPVLLVNPRSGDGKAARLDLVARATEAGVQCHEIGPGDDLRAIVEKAVQDGADVIGVAGGDGSQAIVADVVSRADLAMVVIPAGTRNHLAMDLGLDRTDPVVGLEAFREARERRIDLARVNGQAFLNNVSMGLYGDIVQRATYRERKLGTAMDELPALVSDPARLQFTGPDGQSLSTAHVVLVSNNPYLLDVRGAGGRPRLNSGMLGIVTAELKSAAGVTEMLARAAVGLLAGTPGFWAWQTQRFEVGSDGGIAAGVDGEAVVLAPPVEFWVEPAALRVRLPASALGRSPAAFVPQFRLAVVELVRRAFLPVRQWRPLPRR